LKEGKIVKIKVNEKVVPIDQVEPNKYNPNTMSDEIYEKEKNSIVRFGFIEPILVRRIEKKKYQIIDGEHRWKACKDLGFTEISINDLGVMKNAYAKELTILINEIRGENNVFDLAELLKAAEAKYSMEEISKLAPYSEAELQDLVNLTDEFDFSSFELDGTHEFETDTEDPEKFIRFNFRLPVSEVDKVENFLSAGRRRLGIDHAREEVEHGLVLRDIFETLGVTK
jgi:ParB/RepB/Spo0J family partition protein